MKRARVGGFAIAIVIAACASTPPPPDPNVHAQAKPVPRAIERCFELSKPGDGMRVGLDADGLLVETIQETTRGATTVTYVRTPGGLLDERTAVLSGGSGPPKQVERTSFVYGPHGELVTRSDWADGQSRDVVFAWRGQFFRTPHAVPASFVEGGGATEVFTHDLLPSDLAARSDANPMAPLGFSGTVQINYDGRDRSDFYEYDVRGLLHHAKSLDTDRTLTWNDERRLVREEWTERSIDGVTRAFVAVHTYEGGRHDTRVEQTSGEPLGIGAAHPRGMPLVVLGLAFDPSGQPAPSGNEDKSPLAACEVRASRAGGSERTLGP